MVDLLELEIARVRSLRLIFELDTKHPDKGRPYFWCAACNRGIFFSRTHTRVPQMCSEKNT
ncbi:hypothetical protein ACIBF7_44910 [Nonomuraea sp. NPDC050478]|uniref:hypothetical protein n=1 Tax=Nonomuraea sp. NPDC050478 TaxID=3364365 RepID=UPI00378B89A8